MVVAFPPFSEEEYSELNQKTEEEETVEAILGNAFDSHAEASYREYLRHIRAIKE